MEKYAVVISFKPLFRAVINGQGFGIWPGYWLDMWVLATDFGRNKVPVHACWQHKKCQISDYFSHFSHLLPTIYTTISDSPVH